MKLESSYIYIRKLRFHAKHGVLPQERIVGNDYEIDLRISYPCQAAMLSDEVADALNYASVFELVKCEMKIPSKLLENVAARIVEKLMKSFPKIKSVEISLTKCNPPMGADCRGAGVELYIINDKT